MAAAIGRFWSQEGHADAPVVAAAQKGPGAVNRIDEISERAAADTEIVRRLLRQPAISRTSGEKPIGEQAVDGEIGIADRRAIGLAPTLMPSRNCVSATSPRPSQPPR